MDGIGGATIHFATIQKNYEVFLQIRWPGDELGGEGIVGERGLERSRQGSQCKLLQGQQCNSIQCNAIQFNTMQGNGMQCNEMQYNEMQ